jgi:hypothetical protein
MKYLTLMVLLSVSCFSVSQEKFSHELSIITDNDLYISSFQDRYYSSGFFVAYRYLASSKRTAEEKRIFKWELGHKMYTPYKSTITNITDHDRPFAGYLYGSFGVDRVYNNNQLLHTSLQVGFIGSNSFAREVQEFIHDVYNFRKAIGWKYQIRDAIAVNFNINYIKTIFKAKEKQLDITWMNQVNFGSIFTNSSSGVYTRIGIKPLQELTNTIAFNTNLNNNQNSSTREVESFFYLKPMVSYVFYDATLQGSHLNPTSPVTKEIVPLVFRTEIGLRFTVKHFNFGYAVVFNTKKSSELKYSNGHKYGSITINYLLP